MLVMITKEFLIKEYGKNLREIHKIKNDMKGLAKGSVQLKSINGKEYTYLAYRENGKTITNYIKDDSRRRIENELDKRKQLEKQLEILFDITRIIEKALGRVYANNQFLDETISSFVHDNPQYNIKKIVLFGSRAKATFTPESDVDLLIEFNKSAKTSMLLLSEIRLALIDYLGIEVDLVRLPIAKDSIIEIGKTRVIYES